MYRNTGWRYTASTQALNDSCCDHLKYEYLNPGSIETFYMLQYREQAIPTSHRPPSPLHLLQRNLIFQVLKYSLLRLQ